MSVDPSDRRTSLVLDRASRRRVVDGLRAAGILAVVLFHTLLGLAQLVPEGGFADFAAAIPALLDPAWQALGSEVVFLLSAFLLGHHLLKRHAAGRPVGWREHLARRGSRLLPLHLAALALYGAVDPPGPADWAANLFFVSGLTGAETIVPVGWSLELLVQVYLVLPLAVGALLRCRRPLRALGLALCASVVVRAAALLAEPAALDARAPAFFTGGEVHPLHGALYYRLWFRATPFVLGLGAAWLCVFRGDALARGCASPRRAGALAAAGLAAMALASCLPLHDPRAALQAVDSRAFWLAVWTLQRPLFGAGCAALLLATLYGRGGLVGLLRRPLAWPGWEPVSRGIYSIYLFHIACLVPAAALVFGTLDPAAVGRVGLVEVLGVFGLGALFAVALARLLTRAVERPAQRWLRARWGMAPAAAPATMSAGLRNGSSITTTSRLPSAGGEPHVQVP